MTDRKPSYETPFVRIWEDQDGGITEQRAEMYEMQVVALHANANVELGLRQRFAEAIAQISDEPPISVQFSGGVKPVPRCDELGELEGLAYIFSIAGTYWPRRQA